MEGEVLAGEACLAVLAGPDPPPPRLGPCRAAWRPVVRAEPLPGAWERLARALESGADAVAFTSPRAARALAPHAGALRPLLERVVVAAVGPSTARAVEESLGVGALTPPVYTGRALGEMLAGMGVRLVAWPRGSVYGPGLPSALAEAGVALRDLEVYRLEADHDAARSAAVEAARAADALVLTSGLIARLTLPRIPPPGPPLLVLLGPSVAGAARPHLARLSSRVCTARPHTLAGAAACLALAPRRA